MMILYSGITCPFSHRCRFVLYEKGMDFEIKDVDIFNKPEDLERELFSHVQILEAPESTSKEQSKAREAVAQGLTMLAPMFSRTKYIMGDDFSMIDVALAPLLWRLDHYGIKLGRTAAPLLKYAERIFQREAFIDALTPAEKAMRR